MGKKLYVGSISFDASEESLRDLFSGIGEVESVKIITDMHTGRSKGFGFIEMASEEDAKKAIEQLNGSTFMERTLTFNPHGILCGAESVTIVGTYAYVCCKAGLLQFENLQLRKVRRQFLGSRRYENRARRTRLGRHA